MPQMQTYRLVVEEDESNQGLDVELRDEDDGIIVESTRLDYENYGLEPAEGERGDHHWERELTTDADVLELEVESHGDDFTVEVVGGVDVEEASGEPDTVGKADDEPFERLHLSADDLDLVAA